MNITIKDGIKLGLGLCVANILTSVPGALLVTIFRHVPQEVYDDFASGLSDPTRKDLQKLTGRKVSNDKVVETTMKEHKIGF